MVVDVHLFLCGPLLFELEV